MFKKFTKLAFLIMLSAAAFAQTTPPAANGQGNQNGQNGQRRQGGGRFQRGYTLSIVNNTKIEVDTAKLNADFKAVYPGFAAADGYRTKREVTMRIIDTAKSFTLSAVPGEFIANSNWIKNKKNFANFQYSLQEALHKNWNSVDTIRQNGYQLVFINKNSAFNPQIKKELIETFFTVYPKMVSTFNPATHHEVVFVTDTAYAGVAEAAGNRILFSTKYMNSHPTDIDVVTHEGFHLVQAYGGGAGPTWLTEGIADYIRYKYGVDNVGSKWTMPNPVFEGPRAQSYKNSYRITARFFEWIDQKVKPGMIIELDKQLRNRTYSDASWAQLSGKTVDELWADYAKNPEISIHYSGKERP